MTAPQKRLFLKNQEIRDRETALATAYQKYKLLSTYQAEWERVKDKEQICAFIIQKKDTDIVPIYKYHFMTVYKNY